MKTSTADSQLKEILRGSEEIIGADALKEKLLKGKKLRVKFGADPTAADLHLGHTVIINKLKTFQKFGHKIIFIIGDFTAMIGDPSGRTAMRPVLQKEEIENHIRGYEKQIFKILDKKNVEIVRNSVWLKKLGVEGLIKLASKYTVAQMLERNDFSKRYEKGVPISITEFLYPLLQAYDSVEVLSDIEIGGTDQKFNLLAGREIQKSIGQLPQAVLTMPLLVGTDGVKKMSKTYGNQIGMAESPRDIFGKIMSISDELMYNYYTLLTDYNMKEIKKEHPMQTKKALAFEIVSRYYDLENAESAKKEFDNIFSKGKLPEEIKIYELTQPEKLIDVIYLSGLLSSKGIIKRHIRQGAVTLDGVKITKIDYIFSQKMGGILKIGKRKFLKIEPKA